MAFRVLTTIPVLRIFDLAKTHQFYVDYLGFTVEWDHQFDETAPHYMQISRDGCTLHLSEHHGDGTPGSTVFLRVTGLREFHAELTAKGYRFLRPGVEPTFHNSIAMELTDPFGNRLRFDEANA
jgi:catechol 2,3-dioxygenase-like lactoylglutathione lyase family enzyme